ncbi:MAG: universal stress protein, partial [Myxococcota bacterium]
MSHSILVPLDYTGCAQEVADQAASYASRLGLDVVLFHVVSLPTGVTWATPVGEGVVPPTARDVLQDDAKVALSRFVASFRARGLAVRIETPEG